MDRETIADAPSTDLDGLGEGRVRRGDDRFVTRDFTSQAPAQLRQVRSELGTGLEARNGGIF